MPSITPRPPRRPPALVAATATAVVLAVVLAVALAGCQPEDPLAKVQQVRSKYTVKLNSWHIVNDEAAADADLGGVTAPGEAAPVETGPSRKTILFDVLIAFSGDQPLPGITLDVTQADPFEKEKDHRRHWIDTSKFVKGSLEAITFELGGFDFADGDVFSVDLLPYVSEQNRSEYRELAEAVR
ncbi:MAG: hypothetical protein HC897_16950 [Thermoanaerobaculia bacterium]|nr:hypothetical protein [Thermoanaerobaculia bacterium]